MKYEITLPSGLSAEGRIVVGRWRKEIGDPIQKKDVVLEVETATTILEIESEVEGILADIHHDAGTEVGPDDVLGIIEEQPEVEAEQNDQTEEIEAEAEAEVDAAEEEVAEETEPETFDETSAEPEPVESPAAAETGAATPPPPASRRPITDRARWLATASGVDISSLSGSGPGGRIIVRDVEDAIARQREKEAVEEPAQAPAKREEPLQVPLTPAEQVLAREMRRWRDANPHGSLWLIRPNHAIAA
ncbi:MAG: E3 binding domain-containing protein, partial [Verrucomicrobiae bacterium]|nr:E3 binding domain-containing protein [Verrucomicrobiae bacterium]